MTDRQGGISLRAITKKFGAVEAIRRVDLDIAQGEFVVIVGPSGCGKSTLLRIVAGLEEASTGSVEIRGRDVTDVEPKDRDIAMVFQNYALYPHMSVFDNMAYGLRTRGLGRAEIAEKVQATSQILKIEHLLERRPRQLSGGQRQRVAMGRAMVRQPHAYLFDEPLSNLDAKLRGEMRVELRRLHEQLRVTSLYVTHDQVEAMTLADRLVIMNSGVVEQVGRPIDIYLRPETVYVAGFIGAPAMNLVEARMTPAADAVLIGDAIRLPLALPIDRRYGGQSVVFGVRPESLTLDADHAPASFAARAEFVERLGADTIVHCRINGVAIVVRLDGAVPVPALGDIRLAADPAAFHVFDTATGRRIDAAAA